MSNEKIEFKNCLVLLMGLPGVGKRTIGEELSKTYHFRFSDHHALFDPIVKLFGDDYQTWWNLTPAMWDKINAVNDIYLSAISDICAKEDNFVLTEMMFDKDPYHKIFYDKVLDVVRKRNAHFFPVRLICDENELANRVQSEDRKKYFKTRDVELSRKRSKELDVFYSEHPNEITINNTQLSADAVADEIIIQIKKKLEVI